MDAFPKRFAVVVEWPGGRKTAWPFDEETEAAAKFRQQKRGHPACKITLVDTRLDRIITTTKRFNR